MLVYLSVRRIPDVGKLQKLKRKAEDIRLYMRSQPNANFMFKKAYDRSTSRRTVDIKYLPFPDNIKNAFNEMWHQNEPVTLVVIRIRKLIHNIKKLLN